MIDAREFTLRLADLLRREQGAMADFLVALADFDRRRLWLELGHSSLFYFLHRELGLSKGAACYRKAAADLVRQYPEVVEPLRDGRLCLTSVVELTKVISPENRADVLHRFFHRSKREAKAVSAELSPAQAAPRRDVVTVVRSPGPGSSAARTGAAAGSGAAEPRREPGLLVHPVEPGREDPGGSAAAAPVSGTPPAATTGLVGPGRAVSTSTCSGDAARPGSVAPGSGVIGVVAPAPPRSTECSSRERRDTAEPLTADLRRLHVTVSRRFLDKLDRARAALSHARPGASTEDVLEAALDLLLDRDEKRKGLVEKPRAQSASSKSGHVPAAVKRAVWLRDGGRCQWPLASGGICGSTLRLELDHVVPRAQGGPSTVANVRVLCRTHNDLAARRAFGDPWMDRFTRGPAERSQSAVPSGSRLEKSSPP